jgi:subtilase family serine protease
VSGRSVSGKLVSRGLSAAGILAVVTGLVVATLTAPASAASRHPIAGSTPRWLSHARAVGEPSGTSRIDFGVLLTMRDRAGALATLRDVSEPNSADYGDWLTSAQFRARYSPAAADVGAVRDWLSGQGFRVTDTLAGGMYIEASGSTAQVEKTFATTVKNYAYRGMTVRANDGALSLPAGTPQRVVGAVSGVLGVDQGSQLHQPAAKSPGPPTGSRYGVHVQPCSAYWGAKTATDQPSAYGAKQPYAVCGYGPQQYQSAYGESDLLRRGVDGRGVTVAITDAYAAPTILADAQEYNRVHDQPQFTAGQFRQITPGRNGYDMVRRCGGNGWYGEETLDVEAVHAMAPGADIVYVAAKDCSSGLDDAWAQAIDDHVADVITNSWNSGTDDIATLGADYVQFYDQFALEAALTGITVNFSSGDDGDHTAGGTDPSAASVEFPADEPYLTGVGGTSVAIGDKGQWLWEHGWQTSYASLADGAWDNPPGDYSSGGGGGTSILYEQPFYQVGKVPASISTVNGGAPARAVPDIAMAGDPNTGFVVGETQVFPDGTYWDQYRIGGTSLSSPLLAGVIAVADQYTHRKLGFVNPLYYQMLGSTALHDITAPTKPIAEVRTELVDGVDLAQGKDYLLQTVDVQSSTIHSTPGYDAETGVGSPDGPHFFAALSSAAHH